MSTCRARRFARPLLRQSWILVFGLLGPGALPALASTTFTDATAEVFPEGLVRGHYLWGDCDGDGDEDLLVGGKTLYINAGAPAFTFSQKSDTGDLAAGTHARAIWIDLDNDGDLDLFGIGSGDNERLFENDGTCSFVDISDQDGNGQPDLGDGSPSMSASAGDLDADGFLDVYVGNYERHCVTDPVTVCGDCMTDRLWHNQGNASFADVTNSAGIYAGEHALKGRCVNAGTPCTSDAECPAFPNDSCSPGTCARGSNWVDYDNDGDQDIFVSNYRLDPNLLWENDGTGSFTNVSFEKNVDGAEDNGAWGHVLGTDWADYDNDGDLDLYTANLAHGIYYVLANHDLSQLLENAGAPDFTFSDVRDLSGMRAYDWGAQPDWAETHPAWGDFDNDGDLDIYVTHIYPSSNLNYSTMYENQGDKTFTEVTETMGLDLGLYHNYSAAWSDYDHDGDLDLVTYGADCESGCESAAHFYRNELGGSAPWILVRLVGEGAGGTNRSGVGARLVADHEGVAQLREVQAGHGYHTAARSWLQHFGFGATAAASLEELRVRWTTGVEDTFSGLAMRRLYSIYEARLTIRRGTAPQSLPVFDDAAQVFPYDDSTLNDGQTYFYLVEGAGDAELVVSRDETTASVVLELN